MFLGAKSIATLFKNPELELLIKILCLFPFVDQIILLIPPFMISLDRAVRAGVYMVTYTFVKVAVVITSFALGATIGTIFLVLVGTGIIIALIGCVDMLQLTRGEKWKFDWSTVIEQLHFTWPLWATSVASVISLQYDRLLISNAFDPASYAIYSCGAIQLPIVALITASVNLAIMPNLVTMAAGRKDLRPALNLWQEAARKCSLIVFPCFTFFIAVSYDFMVLLYGKPYAAAAGPFTIYLLMLPVRVALYSSLFRATGKTKPIAIGSIIRLVINIVISTGLVILGAGTYISFIGPSIGTVFAEFVMIFYCLKQIGVLTQMPLTQIMRWRELGTTLILCVIVGVATYFAPLPDLPLIVKLGVQATLFTVLLITIVVFTKHLHKDESEMLSKLILNIKQTFNRIR